MLKNQTDINYICPIMSSIISGQLCHQLCLANYVINYVWPKEAWASIIFLQKSDERKSHEEAMESTGFRRLKDPGLQRSKRSEDATKCPEAS